jgi:2-C-methyl-D-erythritol 4-phosphate cytidylyltransferase
MRTLQGKAEVGVLIPAAGSGTRMGGERKQFRYLGGRPLLVQTLLPFEHHPLVQHIVVAAPADSLAFFEEELYSAGITKLRGVVCGGSTRQDSVAHALGALPTSADVVLVHDAVRPFVQYDHISAIVEAIVEHGAAALAIPVTDTLRQGENEKFGVTMPRTGLYRMQTPQGFQRAIFEKAHEDAVRCGVQSTDDVALVMRLNQAVHIIEGGPENIKITTLGDWEMAKVLWAYWQAKVRNRHEEPRAAAEI